jgi:hypothetical protein
LEPTIPADHHPVKWTDEAATEVADRAAVDMESQAHKHNSRQRKFGYPASMMNKMRGGHSLYQPYIPCLGTEAKETV